MGSFVERIRGRNRQEPKASQEDISLLTVDEERGCNKLPFEEQVCVKTQKMYLHPENGLCKVASDLGASIPDVPDRRINVLILGNHSSGKSSFINWYVGEEIQKTGVAMETSNFTVVCHGKRRETLTAGAVLKLFPKLAVLESIPGAMSHLTGEISSSREHQFKFVNLIDTPGIVDIGRDDFAFDLALKTCAELADLILVFLDPQGQALCKRTMAHLEALCTSQPGKLSLYLTKCDTLKTERDLMKVTQQISRELSRRPVIANLELWLSPIAIPGHASQTVSNLNQIKELENMIERHISEHFQNKVLQDVITQCDRLHRAVEEKRLMETTRIRGLSSENRSLPGMIASTLMLLLFVGVLFFMIDVDSLALYLDNVPGRGFVFEIKSAFHNLVDKHVSPEGQVLGLCLTFLIIIVTGLLSSRPPKHVSQKLDGRIAVVLNGYTRKINEIKKEANRLYNEYLRRAVDP